MEREAREKLLALEELLDSWKTVAVGYSGGVDSTFLAAVCARAVPSRAVLMHIETPFSATPELVSVERAAESGQSAFGLPLIAVPLDPFSLENVVRNDENRCYYCKRAGFSAILAEARARGIEVVVDGSNADDAGDYRPGMRALEELGVRSPLLETGWHKDEERALLREWGIPVWDMPAGACLATRIPCGEPLTEQKLAAVRACEDYLHEYGLHQVRARLIEGSLQLKLRPRIYACLHRREIPQMPVADRVHRTRRAHGMGKVRRARRARGALRFQRRYAPILQAVLTAK